MATIENLKKKPLRSLKAIAVTHFHKYIRRRDQDKPCISCGKYTLLQAGHFYSAGSNPVVRFNEDNVHGQCKKCNYFLSGNLLPYSKNLIDKIGQDRYNKLTHAVQLSKQTGFKWDKFYLIEIIEKYKALNK